MQPYGECTHTNKLNEHNSDKYHKIQTLKKLSSLLLGQGNRHACTFIAYLQGSTQVWNSLTQAREKTSQRSESPHQQPLGPTLTSLTVTCIGYSLFLSLTHTPIALWLLSEVCEHYHGSVPGCSSCCTERQINRKTKRWCCFTHAVDEHGF